MAPAAKGTVLPMSSPVTPRPKAKSAYDDIKEKLRPHLREYLERQGVQFSKGNQFHCPNTAAHSHGDKEASASIKDNHFKCFACGISGDIFDACHQIEGKALSGKGFVSMLEHLANMFSIPFEAKSLSRKAPSTQGEILTNTYTYVDRDGQVQYRVLRFVITEFGKPAKDSMGKAKKKFKPQIYKNGEWLTGYGDVDRILYRLPEVQETIASDGLIFFVEGEKCADIIREKLGFTATTIAGGANAWRRPHTVNYIRDLANANIVILTDNDTTGRKFGETVAGDVSAIASSVKLINLPNLPDKGDIEQWIQLNPDNPKEKLLSIVQETKEWSRIYKAMDTYENPIYIHNGGYFRKSDQPNKGDKPISNFTVHPLYQVVPDESDIRLAQWCVRVEVDNGKSFEQIVTLEAFINRIKFRAAFPHEAMVYTGNDDDLQGIKAIFGAELQIRKRGVQYIGFHIDDKGNELFVSQTSAIFADGADAEDVMLLDGKQRITTNLLETSTISPDELPEIVKALFNYNTLDKCAPIFGWGAACFIKEKLRSSGIKFPHLFIYGEAGSGKSQTVESVLMPLHGTEKKYSAGQLTNFTAFSALSSSNAIPLYVDEYKPHFMGESFVKRISEMLRNSYDQQDVERGRSDMSTAAYKYRAPICLIGEEGTDETANKERGIESLFNKRDIANAQYRKNFAYIKQNQPSLSRLGRSLLDIAMSQDRDYWTAIYQSVMDMVEPVARESMPGLPERVLASIACCVTGLMMLDELLQQHELSILAVTGYDFDTVIDAVLKAVYENTMDERGTPKAAVDNILETMDRMVSQGKYHAGMHFHIIKEKAEIAFDFKLMYDDFTRYCKEYDLKIERLAYAQFTKQIRKKAYFVNYRTVAFVPRYEGATRQTKSVYVCSIEKLMEEDVDISAFIAD